MVQEQWQGTEMGAHEFAWTVYVVWCFKGDFFPFSIFELWQKLHTFSSAYPWKDWSAGIQHTLITETLGISELAFLVEGLPHHISLPSCPTLRKCTGIMQLGIWSAHRWRGGCLVGTTQTQHSAGSVLNTQPCWGQTHHAAGSTRIMYWPFGFFLLLRHLNVWTFSLLGWILHSANSPLAPKTSYELNRGTK